MRLCRDFFIRSNAKPETAALALGCPRWTALKAMACDGHGSASRPLPFAPHRVQRVFHNALIVCTMDVDMLRPLWGAVARLGMHPLEAPIETHFRVHV